MNKDKRNNIKLLGTLTNADESGIIANANQVYDANEDKSTQDVSKEHTERIKTLEAKEDAMQTTLENISKTGEASAASNVTYNHNDSKLDATNVQQAVDEMRELINTHEGNIEELQYSVFTTDFPLSELEPSEIGDGYVLPSIEKIEYGSFDRHAIYNIEKNTPFSINYDYQSGSAYGFIITDSKGNILHSWKTEEFRTGKSVSPYSEDIILYASKMTNMKVYTGYGSLRKELSKISENIPKNISSIYGCSLITDISISDKKFVSGTEVKPLKNGLIQINYTKDGFTYNLKDSNLGKIYSIPKSTNISTRYIYCDNLYFNNLPYSFANVLLLDENDIVIFAGKATSNIILVPANYKCLILAQSYSEICYTDCKIAEKYITYDTLENELSLDLDNGVKIDTSSTGDYIIYNNRVGSKIEYGTFGTHSLYTIKPNKAYKIEVKYPGGEAYDYVITDDNDIVLQVIKSGDLKFINNIATFIFNKFSNAAKLYCSYTNVDVYEVDTVNIKDYLKESYIFTPVSFVGVRHDGYIKDAKVGQEISYGTFANSIEYNIEPNISYKLHMTEGYYSGKAYYYALTDANNIIIELTQSQGPNKTWDYIFGKYGNAAKLFISLTGEYNLSIAEQTDINSKVSNLDNQINNLESRINTLDNNSPLQYIATLNFSCDGDSMTTSWNAPMNKLLGFKTVNSNAMGNATARDRTSATSGTTYYPQWAPDVKESFVDFFGLSDPHYTQGGDSKYTSGTKEFDQATANNCLYGHLGRFIYQVSKGAYPSPNVFILNLMGVNDTWTTSDITDTIGDFEDVISGSYEKDNIRATILGALRWYITKFRKQFPNCKLFFKTSSQQTKDNHTYFYKVYEPVVKLMRYLSVPIIDSYAEIGIMSDLESNKDNSNNQWTSDGTHPTQAGYKMDGEFVATKIYNWFILHRLN